MRIKLKFSHPSQLLFPPFFLGCKDKDTLLDLVKYNVYSDKTTFQDQCRIIRLVNFYILEHLYISLLLIKEEYTTLNKTRTY